MKKRIAALLLALCTVLAGQVRVLDIDVYVTDAGDGFVGLTELTTTNLATNTIARLTGYTTPGDGLGGNYRWDGAAWQEVKGAALLKLATTELDATSKANLATQWPEAVAISESADIEDLGFLKLVNGRIPASVLPNPTPGDLLADRQDITLILGAGQSLSNGSTASSAITTTNPDSDVITFSGGVKSVTGEFGSVIPAVEDNEPSQEGSGAGETGLVLAANELMIYADGEAATSGPQYLVQTTGRGSARLDMLLKGDASGYYESYMLPVIEAAGAYATTAEKSIELPLIIFRQGEGGNIPSTRASYASQLETYRDSIQADAALNLTRSVPLKFVSYQTSSFGGSGTVSALGQWDLFSDEEWFAISSPVYPMYAAGLYSLVDNVHLTSAGYAWLGVYDGQAASDFLYEDIKPARLYPTAVTASGNQVAVTFNVPTAPLAIDTTLVPAVTDYGVRLYDDTGDLTLTNITVVGNDQLVFDVNRAVSTNAKLQIALDYDFTGSTVTNGVASNLRDSTATTTTIDAVSRNLYNWALSSDISVAADTGTPPPVDNLWVTTTSTTEAYDDHFAADDLTEMGTTPVFTGEDNSMVMVGGTVVASSTSLTSGITPTGDVETVWGVVYIDTDAHNSTSDQAILMNTKAGSYNSNGLTVMLNRQDSGGDMLHKITAYDSGGSAMSLYMKHDYIGFALVGFSIDCTNNNRKLFCSTLAANSGTTLTSGAATSSYTPSAERVEIGRGSYTHTGSGKLSGMEIAMCGYSTTYYDADDIAAVIAYAETRLGITLE